MAEARRTTGLSDFGPDDGWVEAMELHLRSLEEEGGLSFVGRRALQARARPALLGNGVVG